MLIFVKLVKSLNYNNFKPYIVIISDSKTLELNLNLDQIKNFII